ncbi:MAG: hypothetical protein ACPL3C_09785, partial [Pyrobaculum sp.]
ATPPPSTIIGALGRLLGLRPDKKPPEDLHSLAQKIGEKPLLWGPIYESVEAEGADPCRADAKNTYIQITPTALINIEEAHYVARLAQGTKLSPTLCRLVLATRPGIWRGKALFYTERVYYICKKEKQSTAERLRRVEFEKLRLVYYLNSDVGIPPTVTRLGGEGGQALVCTQEGGKPPQGSGDVGILLAPALIKPGRDYPPWALGTYDEESHTLKKREIYLGLGYSEVYKTRRPLLRALPPGTVVHSRDRPSHLGELAELGYGATHWL